MGKFDLDWSLIIQTSLLNLCPLSSSIFVIMSKIFFPMDDRFINPLTKLSVFQLTMCPTSTNKPVQNLLQVTHYQGVRRAQINRSSPTTSDDTTNIAVPLGGRSHYHYHQHSSATTRNNSKIPTTACHSYQIAPALIVTTIGLTCL